MEIEPIIVGQLGANCYLVIDEQSRSAAIIDPGDEADRIAQAIDDSGVDLKNILLTHGHPDHAFAAGGLQQRFSGVKLSMHEADVPQLHGDPDIIALFYELAHYVEPTLGEFLSDGDIVRLGETELQVIQTPGHTPGGLCYASGKVCFTGDTLFAGSIGRTDLMGGSAEDLMASIYDKLLSLPGDTVIYPGHGGTSTIDHERRVNPWLR